MKINVSIDQDLVARMDNYSDANYTTRSGLITLALTQYLNSKEMVTAVTRMGLAMQVIAEKGEVDEQTQKELDDFSRLCNMFVASSSRF